MDRAQSVRLRLGDRGSNISNQFIKTVLGVPLLVLVGAELKEKDLIERAGYHGERKVWRQCKTPSIVAQLTTRIYTSPKRVSILRLGGRGSNFGRVKLIIVNRYLGFLV